MTKQGEIAKLYERFSPLKTRNHEQSLKAGFMKRYPRFFLKLLIVRNFLKVLKTPIKPFLLL